MSVATAAAPTGELIAFRGGEQIDERTLRAHLAALLRLEHVAMFLGAGASSGELGGRTLAQTWELFTQEFASSYEWLKASGFVPESGTVSLEHLSDSLEVAGAEWERSKSASLPALLAAAADIQRAVIRSSLLTREWWTSPARVEDPSSALNPHRVVIQKLCAARQPGQPAPWIFTTNYDLAVEWAAEGLGLHVTNGFSGLHYRAFAGHNFDLGFRNVLARGEARFGTYNICLAKLHGSLTWSIDSEGHVVEDSASAVWPRLSKFVGGAGNAPEPFLVYPRLAKFRQTAEFVLGELFRRFTEALSRPQSGLIVSGYSFGDDHLNRVLRAALNNPTLQLVLYVPEATAKDGVLVIPPELVWVKKLAALQLPQVAIVGGGPAAWFSELAHHLPDPTVLDPHAMTIRKQLREWEAWERVSSQEKEETQ